MPKSVSLAKPAPAAGSASTITLRRLHVAVDHPARVGVLQRVAERAADARHVAVGGRPLARRAPRAWRRAPARRRGRRRARRRPARRAPTMPGWLSRAAASASRSTRGRSGSSPSRGTTFTATSRSSLVSCACQTTPKPPGAQPLLEAVAAQCQNAAPGPRPDAGCGSRSYRLWLGVVIWVLDSILVGSTCCRLARSRGGQPVRKVILPTGSEEPLCPSSTNRTSQQPALDPGAERPRRDLRPTARPSW